MSLYSHERKSSNVVVNGVCICTIKSVTPWYFVCCMAFEMVWGCEEWKKGGSQWREGKIIWTTQINWCWDSFIQVRTRISLCVWMFASLLLQIVYSSAGNNRKERFLSACLCLCVMMMITMKQLFMGGWVQWDYIVSILCSLSCLYVYEMV